MMEGGVGEKQRQGRRRGERRQGIRGKGDDREDMRAGRGGGATWDMRHGTGYRRVGEAGIHLSHAPQANTSEGRKPSRTWRTDTSDASDHSCTNAERHVRP